MAVPVTPTNLRVTGTTTKSVSLAWDELPPPVCTPGHGSFQASGHTWSISATGSVLQDGLAVPGGGGTSQLVSVNGTIWGQDKSTLHWWVYDIVNQSWSGETAATPIVTNPTYQVAYRVKGTTTWTLFPNVVSVTSITVTGLVANTTYEMEIVAHGN